MAATSHISFVCLASDHQMRERTSVESLTSVKAESSGTEFRRICRFSQTSSRNTRVPSTTETRRKKRRRRHQSRTQVLKIIRRATTREKKSRERSMCPISFTKRIIISSMRGTRQERERNTNQRAEI